MRTIRTVLATVPWEGDHRRRLASLFAPANVVFARPSDRRAVGEALRVCDAAVLAGPMDSRFLAAPQLAWVHCDQSGLDGFAPPRLFDTDLLVTSSSGRSAPVLAEHALFFMLALCHRWPRFQRAGAMRLWGLPGQDDMRGLHGRRVCIVGMGHTGTALAHLCLALGMEVTSYRRSGRPVPDGVRGFSREAGHELAEAVAGTDFVALCAGLNDGSYQMLGEREIGLVRRGGYVVNVARAQLVDFEAMSRALRDGHLGGAGFDVMDPDEPLPPWSRRWRVPNLMITPHVTPQMPDRTARSLDIIEENHRRYLAGEPLLNLLTREDAFTPRHRRRGRAARFLTRHYTNLGRRLFGS